MRGGWPLGHCELALSSWCPTCRADRAVGQVGQVHLCTACQQMVGYAKAIGPNLPPEDDPPTPEDDPPTPGGLPLAPPVVEPPSSDQTPELFPVSTPPPTPSPDAYVTDLPWTYTADPVQVSRGVAALLAEPILGIDIETVGLRPHLGQICVLQVASSTQVLLVDMRHPTPALLEALHPLFTSPVTLVGHNLQFEAMWLQHLGLPDPVSPMFDTMLADQLLHAGDKPKSGFFTLAAVANRYLQITVDKTMQTADWRVDLTAVHCAYAATDAAVPLRLYPLLRERLADAGLMETFALESLTLPATACMVRTGLPLDAERWCTLADQQAAEVVQLDAQLAALSGSPETNWNAGQQIADVLTMRGHTLPRTKTGQAQTTKEALEPLAAQDPLIQLLLDRKAAQTLQSTFGRTALSGKAKKKAEPPPYCATTGRLYGDFHQLGAATGRMSSSKPNLQNMPKDTRYRSCFVAQPGYALVKADYSQVELRIAAVLYADPVMMAAYQAGADLHQLTAAKLLGLPESAVTKEQRQMAKSVNFGMLFGMGAASLQVYAYHNYGVVITLDEAKGYIQEFLRTYPGAAQYRKQATNDRTEEVRTKTGRRQLLPSKVKQWADGSVGQDFRFTSRLNTPIQGTAADVMKLALAKLYRHRQDVPGVRLCCAVHDEVVTEAPLSQVAQAEAWLREHMMAAFVAIVGTDVPCAVDVTCGQDWAGTPLSP